MTAPSQSSIVEGEESPPTAKRSVGALRRLSNAIADKLHAKSKTVKHDNDNHNDAADDSEHDLANEDRSKSAAPRPRRRSSQFRPGGTSLRVIEEGIPLLQVQSPNHSNIHVKYDTDNSSSDVEEESTKVQEKATKKNRKKWKQKKQEPKDPERQEHKASRKVLTQSHRQLANTITDLRKDIARHQSILQELSDLYYGTEGDCPCFRYSDMREMVEGALEAYGRTQRGEEAEEGEKRHLMGTISRLKADCRKYSLSEHQRRNQEERYSVMTERELEQEHASLQEEHKRLNVIFENEKHKLDRLASRFVSTNKLCCLRRYSKYKAMIEEATVDCLRDD